MLTLRAVLVLSVSTAWAFFNPVRVGVASNALSHIGNQKVSRAAQDGKVNAHMMVEDMSGSDYTRAQLAAKQSEYEMRRKAEMVAQTRANNGGDVALSLAELPLTPYLTPEGKISSSGSSPAVKASVYAIYGEEGNVEYIGVSRNVQQSLRLHLARCPELCHGFRVQHITRPSRTLLEVIKDTWEAENGSAPPGNDEGPKQNMWENPLDVKPLMTEQDKADLADAKARGKEMDAIKVVARRFEADKVAVLEARGVTENLRFDPKLKGTGLLDLWTEKPKNEVPSNKPKKPKPAAGKPAAAKAGPAA